MNDEGVLRKELEKQSQEIDGLTNGLAQITNLVFGLPGVKGKAQGESIVDNTVSAIKILFGQLQAREKELSDFKSRKRSDSNPQPTGHVKFPSRGK